MSDARLSETGEGEVTLAGDLDFATVPVVWPALERAIAANPRLALSLDGVDHANSAGLVMLLEAFDVARRHDCALTLADVPVELVDLARMSNCADLLTAA